MNLKLVSEVAENSNVVLRMDLDVPLEDGVITDSYRLIKSLPTIKLLLDKSCKVLIVGHRGRPQGMDDKYSLKPVYVELMSLLENNENTIESVFLDNLDNQEKIREALEVNQILFAENLRFWEGEERGEAKELRRKLTDFEVYVNDAFAVAHRGAASILLFKEMPGYYGLAFVDEAEKITKVLENPEHPLTIILGGAKEDKLMHLEEILKIADNVLIGGKLPLLIRNEELGIRNEKVVIAKLREDKCDLSEEDVENFKKVIRESKMIVWAGAMGWFEKEGCKRGTEEIARAVAKSGAYKIIAGGDTGASIKNLGLENQIDLVASGGGVMLELLTKGKLPAWEGN